MEKQTWRTIEPQVFKPATKGDYIEGVLVSKIPKEDGMSAKYYISNKDGEHFLWGAKLLDERLQFIKIGALIKITYDGQADYKDNKMHLYTVKIAKTSKIPAEQTVEMA